ncbi:MAG: beta-lactamase family protein [Acidobacteriota bacterium]|nr:MAG: beta-lactamase family protein [Acidobacteriota bacterium]
MPIRSLRLAVVITFSALTAACQQAAAPPAVAPEIEAALQSLVEAVVTDNEAIPGAALHVDTPALDLNWEGAAGLADPETGTPMTPEHPVRIASNSKTFIAAAILRAAEKGLLGLDDPIADHLPEEFVELLRSDGYDTRAMTIRHLLTHTSGLFDHTSPDAYAEAILAEPTHRWTRAEQLQAAIAWGDPHGSPGEIYSYCDTGYVLLGEVLEQATGQSMPQAVRELVGFEQLGLDSTWWETLEPPPESIPDRAHQFYGDLDTTDFDPAFDLYGGGGLVATVGDMARFFRALFSGGVYENRATADAMLTTIEGTQPLPDASDSALPPGAYRMGLWMVELDGHTTFRHSGFWGTVAMYVPQLELTIAATVNQNQGKGALENLVREAVALVGNAGERVPN